MKQKKFLKTGAKAKSKFHNENNQKNFFFLTIPYWSCDGEHH